MESRGYRVIVAPNSEAHYDELPYLAGSDAQRADDLNSLIRNPEVDLVLCARGGYGCARILDRVDYAALRADPKGIVGYSDITALSFGVLARAGVVSFSGLMAMAGYAFAQDSLDPWSEARFFDAVAGDAQSPIVLPSPEEAAPWEILRGPKSISGPVIPMCFSLLESLFGTPYVPDLSGAILVIEDIHEELYAVDRCLTMLRLAGVLDGLAGVLVGSFNGVGDDEMALLRRSLPHLLATVVPEHVAIATGVAYGHIARRLTIPVGGRATVDLEAGVFTFDPPASHRAPTPA